MELLQSTDFWLGLMLIIWINIILSGDNAVVIALAARSLPPEQQKKAIMFGSGAAVVLRIGLTVVAAKLMTLEYLQIVGGLLLLWVAWRMYRDLHADHSSVGSPEIEGDEHSGIGAAKSFAAAAWSVAVADVSMSLDNVLAVAGAAREHPGILIVGLIFAVALMGVAANIIARYIERYRWIAWIGLAVIVYVAGKMIWEGFHEVHPHILALAGR